jgi:iron complex transport system permease protein
MIKAWAFLLALVLLSVASVLLGPSPINPVSVEPWQREALLSLRLPRVLTALLVGGALGVSGVVLQGMLRNPLADPYVLGLSGGATLLAAGALLLGIVLPYGVAGFALLGALLTGAVVGALGWRHGGLWPERLILAGIGLGFLASALLMLLMSLSTDEALRRAVLWMFGDLSLVGWRGLPLGAALVAVGASVVALRARALNALLLGDELAHTLGFSPQRERLVLFVATCLLVAASVSMAGVVGFVGLLVPHIMRALVGADAQRLVPAGFAGGAALLVVADFLGRTALSPTELPAGVITAIIGAPYFLYLLRKKGVLSV